MIEQHSFYLLGLDIGSTTAKMVITDPDGKLVHHAYKRHHAAIRETLLSLFREAREMLGDISVKYAVTGSAGMGLAEREGLPFVQEVIAAATVVKQKFSGVKTLIDIGGEDAKMVFFEDGKVPDMRMNGSCAGGTGAFIDQMATLLGNSVEELNHLALRSTHVYPIASRCGVFSKTDIQNLIARNVSREDIAASVFHAIAIQTLSSLSRGYQPRPVIMMCGGPFAFIPALRKAFVDYLHLTEKDYVVAENAELIPAWGSALHAAGEEEIEPLSKWEDLLKFSAEKITAGQTDRMEPLFSSAAEWEEWKKEKEKHHVTTLPIAEMEENSCFLGIDCGSTTTKIVALTPDGKICFQYYARNLGDPIETVTAGLAQFQSECKKAGKQLTISGSCVTGYGEDLIKAAFNLDFGVIETIAHYLAAEAVVPQVSFILDIGGQDMKAIFCQGKTISKLEINESCSSGCGSFIEAFANSLQYPVADFATMACTDALYPCNLGTRCTVFMNSKVKQFLREGATAADIAAGLAYSVAKNCLFKVLKLRTTEELGKHIIVQGGTMRNHAVVRAFEKITGVSVSFTNIPELMGAYGCALYALSHSKTANNKILLSRLSHKTEYKVSQKLCKGCENQCFVKHFSFPNGNTYYSGNKCEKVFSNGGNKQKQGENMYAFKHKLLFDRPLTQHKNQITVGIPRALGMFENYPFWHSIFTELGFNVVLSSPSTMQQYEKGSTTVMADNICFPAKLMHGHIIELCNRGVARIFYPYVVQEHKEDSQSCNSFNCPIVSGYSDVIKSAINPEKQGIVMDSPVIVFHDYDRMHETCFAYFKQFGFSKETIRSAVEHAHHVQQDYYETLNKKALEIYRLAQQENRMVILLAGRPYHSDPLVQHKLSFMISGLGADVITEDIVRHKTDVDFSQFHFVSQWAYPNRILKAAQWCGEQPHSVHFVELTSFGCGPDAFLLDEVSDKLSQYGKNLTLLKIDDVNNIGSLRLRIRSLVESLKFQAEKEERTTRIHFATTKPFETTDQQRTILAPYFGEYYTPLLTPLFKLMGFNLVSLKPSDQESIDTGLLYISNDVCYPATLVIGDLIKALQSGKYDLSKTAVAITQTGGQCRATNYLPMLKRAMVSAGLADVPVISVSTSGMQMNRQPGFDLPIKKYAGIVFSSMLFADCIGRFYYSSIVREKELGLAKKLKEKYLRLAAKKIAENNSRGMKRLLKQAAKEFDSICKDNLRLPRIGVVGEIYLKFNSFGHKHVVRWLSEQGVEVVAPIITNFFMQVFANRKIDRQMNIVSQKATPWMEKILYFLADRRIKAYNRIASGFRYYIPLENIFEDARNASEIVNLAGQFGEGWLIPGELVSFAKANITHVVSLQPFGCIANHVISKGIEKKVKDLYPQMNLLFLDFDSNTGEVNVLNRLHFMLDNIKVLHEQQHP